MRLLLLEDDDITGAGLRDYLRAEGHVVDWCRNLADTASVAGEPFDALLLDWQLPDGSGLAWLREQRAQGCRTPALMLTARDRVGERIHGLDSGADDYLVKPFAPEELVARLRAVLRRSLPQEGRVLQLGAVEIDLTARSVRLHGEAVALTAREWALLEALASRLGHLVAKADLERLLMGGQMDWSSNALEVHVSALRRKLGPELITTVRGLGYRIGGE